MPPFLLALLGQGLSLTANAVLAKGKEWVKKETGVDIESTQLSSEDLTKIKQWELEHELELQKLKIEDNKLDVELFRLETVDVANARSREVELQKASQSPWWLPSITSVLAVVVVLGGGLMFQFTQEADARLAIVGTITMVLGYYFGTSKSSAEKTAQTTKLVNSIVEK